MARHMGRVFGYLLMMVPMGLAGNSSMFTQTNKGLVYGQSDDVSMEKEELFISQEKIKIFYTFYNYSDKDITSQVVFPLPPIPNNGKLMPEHMGPITGADPLWGAYQLIELATSEPEIQKIPFFQNWSVSLHTGLNWRTHYPQKGCSYWDRDRVAHDDLHGAECTGVEWRPMLRYRALDKKGRDITKTLKENNIPVSAATVFGAFDYVGLVDTNPDLVKRLQKLDLIDINHATHPQWSNQISYVWTETFPAKDSLEVNHSYSPFLGNNVATEDSNFNKGLKPIDGDEEAFQANALTRPGYTELSYVLATGGNWKGGAIKDFTITIQKPKKNNMLATNFPGTFKVLPNGDYQCHISGFKPPQEPLRVVWFNNALLKDDKKQTASNEGENAKVEDSEGAATTVDKEDVTSDPSTKALTELSEKETDKEADKAFSVPSDTVVVKEGSKKEGPRKPLVKSRQEMDKVTKADEAKASDITKD